MTRVLVRFDALLIFALAGCAVFEPPLERRDGGAQSVDSGGRDTAVARDSGSDASPDAGFDAATDAPPSCVVESIMAVDMCTGDVVINEVDGSGDDFIEIYNRGTVAVNVSNWVISDDNAGAPDVASPTESSCRWEPCSSRGATSTSGRTSKRRSPASARSTASRARPRRACIPRGASPRAASACIS
jgi:hypothetical protein